MKHKIFYLCTVLIAAFAGGCTNQDCHDLSGRWDCDGGQAFIFEAENKAVWLVQFGSKTDSLPISYTYDCKNTPAELTLSNFSSGPYKGKNLYGIIDWNNKNTFRFDAEAGNSPEVRPKKFNAEQTQVFSRN